MQNFSLTFNFCYFFLCSHRRKCFYKTFKIAQPQNPNYICPCSFSFFVFFCFSCSTHPQFKILNPKIYKQNQNHLKKRGLKDLCKAGESKKLWKEALSSWWIRWKERWRWWWEHIPFLLGPIPIRHACHGLSLDSSHWKSKQLSW